jgi:hypothetical protein
VIDEDSGEALEIGSLIYNNKLHNSLRLPAISYDMVLDSILVD